MFMDWLRSQRPDLVPLYEELYANGAYAPAAERRRLAALLPVSPSRAPAGLRRADAESVEPSSLNPNLRLRRVGSEGSAPGRSGQRSNGAPSQQAAIGLQKALF